jgi:hypothetical protein
MKLGIIIFFLLLITRLAAQNFPCAYWPAPCPNESALNSSNDWGNRMKDNVALKQELVFDQKMKQQLTNILTKAINQQGWKIYQLTENTHDGPPFIFISYDAWENTPYEKRPPRSYDITYILVINKDSLNKWREWRIDFQSKAETTINNYVDNAKKVNENPLLKVYFDSANYFTQLRTKYLEDHNEQYQKDLKAGNKNGINEYERNQKTFLDKSDYYIKKYQDLQNEIYADSNKSIDQLQQDEANSTATFAGSAIVLLHFAINPYLVTMGLEDANQRSLIPQYPLKVSGASFAGLLVNKAVTDKQSYDLNYRGEIFNSPASVATIMFGNYQPKDSYNNYRPVFEKTYNSKSEVIGTEKKIKCDTVQNIAVHIEGRPDKVRSVLTTINWNELNELLEK